MLASHGMIGHSRAAATANLNGLTVQWLPINGLFNCPINCPIN
jgi:hypothetical protein